MHHPASLSDLGEMWPFHGRSSELARASETLHAGRPVVVVGLSGVGKSRFASEVARVSGDDHHVVTVQATAAAASLPFGAFAPLLPDLVEGREPDRLSLFARIVAHLTELADGRPVLLVVDDAHLLDPPGAALLLHLARSASRASTLILTVRSGEHAPDAVTAVWKDDLADRIDLRPLSRTELDRVTHDVLGRPLTTKASERVWQLTRGNPLFAREVLRALTDHERLRICDGSFDWDGRLPIGQRLADLVIDRLDRLEPAHRNALEIVALAEPVGARLVCNLTAEDATMVLERSGLVRVTTGGRRADAGLSHPLYGEILRSLIPASVARAHRRALAEATEQAGARRREDLLRIAVWRLDADGHGDPGQLTDAAFRATRTFDPPLGERLARAALDAGAGCRAELALAESLNLQRRADEAEDALARAWDALIAADPATARSAALQRVLALHFGANRSAEANDHLAKVAGRHPGAWDQQIQGLKSLVLTAIDLDEAHRLAAPLIADPTADPWARHFAGNAVVTSLSFAGATDQALAVLGPLLGEALELVPEFPYAPAWILTLHARVLGNAGRFADIESLVGGLLGVAESTGDDQSLGGAYMGLGHRAYYGGELPRANEMLTAALGRLAVSDLAGLRPWTLAVRTMALAALGDVPATAAVYGELAEIRDQVGNHPFSAAEIIGAQAWAMASAGDMTGARTIALDGARRATLRMHRAMLAVIAHRLGAVDEEVTEVLLPATADVESALMGIYHDHAQALANGHPPKCLEAVASAYAATGMAVHAAEAWVEAAEAHHKTGNSAAARRCGGQARALLAGPAARAQTPIIRRLDTPELTDRERELATLAAQGRANAEIAAHLSISVRTVEWHLSQAYTKLGVRGRSELAAIFGTSKA